MVVGEGIERRTDRFQALYIMGDLEIVVVIVSGVQRFMKLVIGNGVEHLGVHPSGIFPMDHFAHQPKFRLHGRRLFPKLAHEGKIQHIGAVQTDPVDIKFMDPEMNRFKQVTAHLRVFKIEAGKDRVALPAVIMEGIAHGTSPIEAHVSVPIPEGRSFLLLN